MTAIPTSSLLRPVFLLGPPGVGKTTLGHRAADQLALRFVDLPSTDFASALREILTQHSADVIALPWAILDERRWMAECRRAGALIALWDHPLAVQARSGRAEPIFTASPQLKTHGGFGREGTRCPEFRRLARTCENVLFIAELSVDVAATDLRDFIVEIQQSTANGPLQDLSSWVRIWRTDHPSADPLACSLLSQAMEEFLQDAALKGTSPRTLGGIRDALQCAGHLVLMYDTPKGKEVLDLFGSPPHRFEYQRKFSAAPAVVARYERTLTRFGDYLRSAAGTAERRRKHSK